MSEFKLAMDPGGPGAVPEVSVEGTASECGFQLGRLWAEALRGRLRRCDGPPWWRVERYAALLERYAPHLPAMYEGMARGAGLEAHRLAMLGPVPREGCTSFALHPSVTLNGAALCGQTKDTPISRIDRFQVLRMNMTDAPSMMTLTYPGWLYGHGFVAGGCAVWRNALFTDGGVGLPYPLWGLLMLHCESVDDAVDLARRYGHDVAGHVTVADARGDIVGIECAAGGVALLEPDDGIYVHANAVRGDAALKWTERDLDTFRRDESLRREDRLRARFAADRGRLTAQLVMTALADHDNYPQSICRHQGEDAMTTAAVVAEPSTGRLHVVRGQPCHGWARTYAL